MKKKIKKPKIRVKVPKPTEWHSTIKDYRRKDKRNNKYDPKDLE